MILHEEALVSLWFPKSHVYPDTIHNIVRKQKSNWWRTLDWLHMHGPRRLTKFHEISLIIKRFLEDIIHRKHRSRQCQNYLSLWK